MLPDESWKVHGQMIPFLFWRILGAVPVLFVVCLVCFVLVRLTGDPAAILGGDFATDNELEVIRNQLGLDEPLSVQFLIWLGKILQGDLGTSVLSGLPVGDLILQRLPPTLSLSFWTITLAVFVAVPLGTLAAWSHGGLVDRTVMVFSVLAFSVPVFVLGYATIALFAIELQWFPVQGFLPLSAGLGPHLHRIALPTVTLALVYIALITRITRSSVLDVLNEDYIRTARAKGTAEFNVLSKHALRNSLVPVLTVIGNGIALIISGAVVTETVFNLPGLGRLVVDAVLARDYPVIQAVILLTALSYVLINLMIDIAYGLLDPRIKIG